MCECFETTAGGDLEPDGQSLYVGFAMMLLTSACDALLRILSPYSPTS